MTDEQRCTKCNSDAHRHTHLYFACIECHQAINWREAQLIRSRGTLVAECDGHTYVLKCNDARPASSHPGCTLCEGDGHIPTNFDECTICREPLEVISIGWNKWSTCCGSIYGCRQCADGGHHTGSAPQCEWCGTEKNGPSAFICCGHLQYATNQQSSNWEREIGFDD